MIKASESMVVSSQPRLIKRLLFMIGLAYACALSYSPLSAKDQNQIDRITTPNIEYKAAYPEGPVFIDGDLYFTEMTRNRVMKWEQGISDQGAALKPKTFYYQKDCGPTALARYQKDKFVILCHLSDELVILDKIGKPIRHITKDKNGKNIFHPNDCIKDEKGGVYISAPGHFDRALQPMGRLYYLSQQGQVSEIARNLIYPNGVALYKNHLYVSEHLNQRVLKYKIKSDATLALGKASLFTDFKTAPKFKTKDRNYTPEHAGPDGIEITKSGRIFIAEYARGRILEYTADGSYKRAIITHLPYTTNMAYNPANGNLIITGANSLNTFLQMGKVYEYKVPTELQD